MGDIDPGSLYHSPEYHDDILYQADPRSNLRERPRPASAREVSYGEMFDSGIHAHMSSPRLNQPYVERISSGLELDGGRAVSLDRRGDPYGTLRGQFDTLPTRQSNPGGRPNYAIKTLSSNPGIDSMLNPSNPSHRRAHSYDVNLEKQGLSDYNNLLAAAGIGGADQALYGTPPTQTFNYPGLNVPTFQTYGGLDYVTVPQSSLYSAFQPNLLPVSFNPDPNLVQRECLRLQHEVGFLREKLNACTASIRTFWSPELKRERAMRKEENAKYAILADHLHQLQLEKQTMLETLQNMEAELRRERDFRIRGRFSNEPGSEGMTELDTFRKQVEDLTLENRQLKKSMEDAERRTASVKASLTATEESLRRLIDAVKAGKQTGSATGTSQAAEGLTTVTTGDTGGAGNIRLERIEADRNEINRLRNQLNEACTRGSEAERQLVERNFEYSKLKEDFDLLLQDHRQLKQENDAIRQDMRQTQTLQSLVDTKESKIMTLENEIRLLEDELSRLRDDGLITPNTSTSSGFDDLDKTLQAFRSNERLLKSKVEMLGGEISKRDCEIYTLQSRLEMTDKQHQDQTHHISVLKEQIKTKEHKISMLTVDMEDFRKRLKEKETQLDKKTKALNAAQTAKRQLENELSEVKEQLDIKERKLCLLQRKIENLEDLLNDRDAQIVASKVKLSKLHPDKFGMEPLVTGLEEMTKEHEKSGERTREQRFGQEFGEDADVNKRLIQEFRNRLDATQRELDEKATQLLELREELSELRGGRARHESELSQLQTQLNQRTSEIATLQMEKQMQHNQLKSEYEMKFAHKMGELESQVSHYMEANSKLQSEVDRLMRNLENEKFEKDRQLREVQDELNELQNNLSSLKRAHQSERKKQVQLLEETRQREENAHSDLDIMKGIMSDKDARIRELEQALRESVRLTTEREMYASGREDESRQMELQARELRNNLEQIQRERNNLSAQLSSVQEELSDRENQLKTLEQECFQNYLPELEKLRRENHEANLRVAAMVKLTQGREHTLTDQDRVALSGIPMFPNLASTGGYAAGGSGTSRLYVPTYRSAGSTSPHLVGSAFQLIGNQSSWPSGRASVPGQSMASPDIAMLTRILQEKENELQQHLHELTSLRFRNSEQEIRLKAMQRELDAKTMKLSIHEATQHSGGGYMDSGPYSPNVSANDVSQLRKANHELTIKCTKLQMELDDLQRHSMPGESRALYGTDFSEMAVLRRELITVKAEKETEIMNLNNQLGEATKKVTELNNELIETRSVLTEQENQIRSQKAEKDKDLADRNALQKKYETVLNQLGEKNEKVQKMEIDCYKSHIEEIKRQKTELEDLKHHVSYLQNTIQERESRIETIEKESFKLKDEMSSLRKQLCTAESEAKTLREDVTYREERSRQVQAQHTDELSRHRAANQELHSRISHLELKLDEKEHELKSQMAETRRQTDEVSRLQNVIEDVNNRLGISQKRVEEREQRLRKVESENHDLLDEIHVLRKGNTELESQVDSLRQRLLDRPAATAPLSVLTSPPITYSSSSHEREETERLRKQNTELRSSHEQLQKRLDELQIQYDQITVQRNGLKNQLEEEAVKITKLQERLRLSEKRKQDLELEKPSTAMLELQNEVERKEAQIACLTQELDRLRSGSAMRDRFADTTSQQLLITDLQVRLRQALEERDQVKEELAIALSHVESTYVETNQHLIQERQTLQEQITALTQTVQNANNEAERCQRETRQANTRVQQLSRQLQETQNNCDTIARQRDSLREQLDHFKRTGARGTSFGGTSVANLFGLSGSGGGTARPASAGPGSHETSGHYSATGGSTSHLSRELDRLHREYENVQHQLQTALDTERSCRDELDQIRAKLNESVEEVQKERQKCMEIQSQKDTLEKTMENMKRDELEKSQAQQKEFNENFRWAQQQLTEKTQQCENLSHQLGNARNYCGELEQRITELTNQLRATENQMKDRHQESQRFQQMENDCNVLRQHLQERENEVKQLTTKCDQLSRDCEKQTRTMEQMAVEMSNMQAQVRQAQQDARHKAEETTQSVRESDRETIRILQEEIREAAVARERLEEEFDQAHAELQRTKELLKEKTETLEEWTKSQQRKEEQMESLQKDLLAARNQIEDLGGPTEPSAKGSPLKREIDSLKREIIKRDDMLAQMERECQDRHIRRIEGMQAQLRRMEEETANLNKVLDEQRAGIDQRDNMIRQLRTNQSEASNVELEKMRSERTRYKEQYEQQVKQINTLTKQLENQSDEILAIKLESLTASLCEKEANIALMEMTAPKNAATEKALGKLRTERDQLQVQQRQLANTRALLEEEKKSRR